MRRLRAMWVNVIKVRHLASRLIGDDLSQRILGIDEKPLHMNEGGSKCVGTLEIAGAPMVVLKENHTQTRERVSLMTTVTSCEVVATWSELMPLELLCKGKTQAHQGSAPTGRHASVPAVLGEGLVPERKHIAISASLA